MNNNINNTTTFNKSINISLLRIIATLAVIFIHTNNTLANNSILFGLTEYQQVVFNCAYTLANWAVPVFFMITGALLLNPNKTITIKDCVFKYLRRILLAIVIFGIPFSCIEIFMETRTVNFMLIINSIKNVISGNTWGHLWYLYELIGIYLILPFVKYVTDKITRNEYRYLLLLLFVVNIVIKCFGLNSMIALNIPVSGYSVFYLILGQYLYRFNDEIRIKKGIRYTSFILIFAAIIVVNIIYKKHGIDYLGYGSPLVALQASIIFGEIINRELQEKRKSIIWKIDRLCFGTYLIHPVYTNFMYKFLRFTPLSFGDYFGGIIICFLIFVILGFATSYVMNKIKILRKYVI